MQAALGDRARIGAGTVLTPEEVRAVAATGASFIVSPNADPRVIARTKAARPRLLPRRLHADRMLRRARRRRRRAEDLPRRRPRARGPEGAARRPAAPARASMPSAASARPTSPTGAPPAPTASASAPSLFQPGWPVARVAEAARASAEAFDAVLGSAA